MSLLDGGLVHLGLVVPDDQFDRNLDAVQIEPAAAVHLVDGQLVALPVQGARRRLAAAERQGGPDQGARGSNRLGFRHAGLLVAAGERGEQDEESGGEDAAGAAAADHFRTTLDSGRWQGELRSRLMREVLAIRAGLSAAAVLITWILASSMPSGSAFFLSCFRGR
jgi:hypothetical protein